MIILSKLIDEGKQDVLYFSKNPTLCHNGLYIIMSGKSYPSPSYRMFRDDMSGKAWGGVYVFEYILSGRGYIECDGEKHIVSEGDFVFMNARRHIEYYSDPDDPYSKVWLNFSGPFAKGMVDALSLKNSVYILKYDAFGNINKIQNLLMNINEQNKYSSFDEVAHTVCSMFLKLNCFLQQNQFKDEKNRMCTAQRIKAYIDSVAVPSMNLDNISLHFGLDKGYIVHRFKSKYGISPYKYINIRKIESAKIMLSEKNMKIGDVSNVLGYSCTQHFSSSFKKMVGKTPKEYISSNFS